MNGIATFDIVIIAGYLLTVLGVGIYMGRRESDTRDFVVGGRKVPWVAVLMSIVATEISAATFIGVPSTGYSENFNYLQFGIGSLLARVVIAFIFISAYYKNDCLTVYQYLAKRFGGKSSYTASVYFVITRLLASSVRLMIAALAFATILDLPYAYCLFGFALVAVVYATIGGIKAVIWTDLVQATVFIGSGLAVVLFLESEVGLAALTKVASEAGRTEVFRFTPEGSEWHDWFNDPNLIYIALLNGFIMTVAALGVDQDLTQRMLACKDAVRAQRSVILSGVIGIPVAAMFLFIGAALYGYYQLSPEAIQPEDNNKVFAHFIIHELPVGLKGLLISGVLAAAMSSLDSAMSALSSTSALDLFKPLLKREPTQGELLRLSRLLTILFAELLVALALILEGHDKHLWLCFQVVAITYGSMLGVFLVGMLTRRGSDRGNVFAMLTGTFITIVLLLLIQKENLGGWFHEWVVSLTGEKPLPLAWTWLILIGTLWTFLTALVFHKEADNSETTS